MRFLGLGLALALVAVGGCAGDESASQSDDATAAVGPADGTPEAVGILELLADPATTVETLDVSVGLDARAAKNLVAHRDGADGIRGTKDDNAFGTIAEVESIPYVASSAMAKLVAYAGAHDFTPEGDELLGTYKGVAFSVNQAGATLALVNASDLATLDTTVGLDARAAKNIVAGQPFQSVLGLSQVAFVGASTLSKLEAYTTPAELGADVVAELGPEVEGLLYPSESDYPFTTVLVPGAGETPISADNIKDRVASVYVQDPNDTSLANRAVQVRSLDAEFARFITAQPWWDDSYYAQQAKYQAIYDTLKHLKNVKVYRLGRRNSSGLVGAIDLYIVGESGDGALAGLHTVTVET